FRLKLRSEIGLQPNLSGFPVANDDVGQNTETVVSRRPRELPVFVAGVRAGKESEFAVPFAQELFQGFIGHLPVVGERLRSRRRLRRILFLSDFFLATLAQPVPQQFAARIEPRFKTRIRFRAVQADSRLKWGEERIEQGGGLTGKVVFIAAIIFDRDGFGLYG